MKKKKYSYIWVSLVILIFGIIFIPEIVKRIGDKNVVDESRMHNMESHEPLAFITLNGKKRKVPEFSMLNQDSIIISNEDYKDKVYVIDFFFTTCPTICPIMSKNLVEIQDEFREFEQFGVASFTINPVYDTPGILKEYAEQYGISDMDWHLLTGDSGQVYELANSGFNIYAAADPDVPGGFEHSGLFALVDREGYLRSRLDDFGNPIVYYRGTIPEQQKTNAEGESEQISILKEDIRKLLDE
ncbi:MAG: SCO family protein [Flavobacteriaceae bacterium]